jgi:hypothetical protein
MRKRVVGSAIGVLALASACATSTGSGTSVRLDESLAPQPATPAAARAAIDSMRAQAIADRDGPRVNIRAQVTQFSGTRRLRAAFEVEDDAYVMIGHVDASGVVRVVFPSDPHDDGFVQGGGKSYETAEFFGGFADQYSFRYSNFGRFSGPQNDAYDGGGGYLFIVASWRPMHFEKLTNGGDWDTFEVTTAAYVHDPRPAIEELASVLVGDTREAYTVKFASYLNTENYSPQGGYSSYSAFGLSSCAGSFFGFPQSIPWAYLSVNAPFLTTGFGSQIFSYRGRSYAYDMLGDCAVPLPYGYSAYGYPRIASNGPVGPGNPGTNPITGRSRVLSASDSHRNPFDPKPPVRRVAPQTAQDANSATQGMPAQVSPQYRNRGLITAEQPNDGAPRRAPGTGVEGRTRPSIQQMTERRTQNTYDGSGYTRARVSADDGNASAGGTSRNTGSRRLEADDVQRTPIDRPQTVDRSRNRDPEQASPRTYDNPRAGSPRSEQPRAEQPRNDPPRSQPRTEQPRAEQPTRSAPPPRSEPRSESPARTATPKPSEPAPRSTPPSTPPSTTSGKPTPP